MKMSDMGEKNFLLRLLPTLQRSDCFINGFGHDASILDIGLPEHAVAFKIDRAAKPIAAFNGWTDFGLWGRLAVTANLSDLLAIGATPKGFMLSLAVPRDWEVERTEAVIRGAAQECAKNNVAFLGGDTKEANEAHVVGAAIGVIKKANTIGRRAANPGDAIVLAGQLGGFAGAYVLVKNGLSNNPLHIAYLAHPSCALNEASYLLQNCNISSGVDLSDGLWEGLQLLLRSEDGLDLMVDDLPLHPFACEAATATNANSSNFAFAVGDWGILFTMPMHQAQMAIANAPEELKLSIIGKVRHTDTIRFRSELLGKSLKLRYELRNEHFVQRMENETDYFDHILGPDFLV